MNFSRFGEKFIRKSGIMELMEDIGLAFDSGEETYLLGGGNPAHIPEVNKIWEKRVKEILSRPDVLEDMLTNYDSPHGTASFLQALADLFNREYGWGVTPENIAVTPGSQTAFFVLLNMFGGTDAGGMKRMACRYSMISTFRTCFPYHPFSGRVRLSHSNRPVCFCVAWQAN